MPSQKYVTLTLRNPSPYPRSGFVVRAWAPVAKLLGAKTPAARVVREVVAGDPDTKTRPLDAQVDVLDPDDPDRTQLVFSLAGPIRGGDHSYATPSGAVRVHAATDTQAAGAATVERHFSGAKLRNDYLELWINTAKKRDEGAPGDFYSGSVTSVYLLKQKIDHPVFGDNLVDALDAAALTWDRNPEQRAMQIDRIHLVRPPWDERGSVDAFPSKDHWRIVTASEGPVRATVTIASQPFEYECKDMDGAERVMHCTVYRALSLYGGEEFVSDEVWISAIDARTKKAQRVWFGAGYFMAVNFTDEKEIFRYPDHPGWFTIHTDKNEPRQGYAFATDARATALWTPPLDYPHRDNDHRAFSWEVGPARVAHSFHAFRINAHRQEITDLAGLMWYHLAFKRIRATLENEK